MKRLLALALSIASIGFIASSAEAKSDNSFAHNNWANTGRQIVIRIGNGRRYGRRYNRSRYYRNYNRAYYRNYNRGYYRSYNRGYYPVYTRSYRRVYYPSYNRGYYRRSYGYRNSSYSPYRRAYRRGFMRGYNRGYNRATRRSYVIY